MFQFGSNSAVINTTNYCYMANWIPNINLYNIHYVSTIYYLNRCVSFTFVAQLVVPCTLEIILRFHFISFHHKVHTIFSSHSKVIFVTKWNVKKSYFYDVLNLMVSINASVIKIYFMEISYLGLKEYFTFTCSNLQHEKFILTVKRCIISIYTRKYFNFETLITNVIQTKEDSKHYDYCQVRFHWFDLWIWRVKDTMWKYHFQL